MSKSLKSNKFILVTFVLTILVASITFSNLPGPITSTSVQTVNGTTFDFASYKSLTHEQIGLFNYLYELVDQPYGEWEDWYVTPDVYGLLHYVPAFMTYSLAMYTETIPGYRTDRISDVQYGLIEKMNTSYDDWGESSIEYTEWLYPSETSNWTGYYYPDPISPDGDDVYTGGFRGPANIMWTAHYALFLALFERNFEPGLFTDELTWYIDDWNNSLTTDGLGNPQDGGIWETGLIPCEPYEVWVQCNSIPIYLTELYDNLYSTQYMESGMWDYGLEFSNEVMQDEYSLFVDGYFVQEPMGFTQSIESSQQQFPGNRLSPYSDEGLRSRGYGVAWSLAFLDYTQPEETVIDYPIFMDQYTKEVSGDQMYMVDSFYNVNNFGSYEILASLFTLALSKQMGDFQSVNRILNFLYNLYNKEWSADGRSMHY
ncbi:MAG: linalool dehydratase/isomerase domain-containing protein, partial [Candidatus Thorarchaeota archaeon]